MSNITQPSGDIKIFIDAFNIEFEKKLKQLVDLQINMKNIYTDAIKLTQPRYSKWPIDPSIKTIGDMFKYSFPDINKSIIIQPESGTSDYDEWYKDISGQTNPDEPNIGIFYQKLRSCIKVPDQILNYNNIKKVGTTNPSLYTPGFYYFDIFMNYILTTGIKNIISDKNFTLISDFVPSGEVLRSESNNKADYYLFKEIIIHLDAYMINITGIDIGLNDDIDISEYSSIKTKYKSGILLDLQEDPYFNIERGYVINSNFEGFYEFMSLYKAFIQAGDNYRTTLLPKYDPSKDKEITSSEQLSKTRPVTQQVSNIYTFNVVNPDTFILVGGTQSLDLTLITEVSFDNNVEEDMWDDISDEYVESDFMGEEEILNLNNAANLYDSLFKNTIGNLVDNTFIVEDSNIDYDSVEYKGDKWKAFKINDVIAEIKLTMCKPINKFESDLKKVLHYIKNDIQIDNMRKAAYLLATAYVESNYSLSRWEADYLCGDAGVPYKNKPCEKATKYYSSTKGKKNYYEMGLDKNGQCYFGRGFIQLTGKNNYVKYGEKIKVDLAGNGDLAMIPINSYKIAVTYMKAARTFDKVIAGDLSGARKSVNGGLKDVNGVNKAYNVWMSIFANYNKQ